MKHHVWGAALALTVATTPASSLEEPENLEPPALMSAAKELEFELGRRKVTGAKVESKLRVPMLYALNDWAPLAREHGLTVAVCEEADCLLLGTIESKALREVAGHVDEAHELFEDLLDEAAERDVSREPRATVGFLFDHDGFGGDAWDAVLDTLVERRYLTADTAEQYKRDPGPLTMRRDLVFLQSTVDLAGDASAGDDEFRLANEVVHKYTQSLVRNHFGQVPEPLRFGMGYVAEQRLFESVYTFDFSGFVAEESHFGWADDVVDAMKERKKDWTPLRAMVDLEASGTAETSQQVTWAALDLLNDKHPDDLCALLTRLADAHAELDPQDRAMRYDADEDAVEAAILECCDEITAKALGKHAKRLK